MDHYHNDFEAAMLIHTSAYYSRKASNWVLGDSCPDYMLKAEECLKWEKDRVANYPTRGWQLLALTVSAQQRFKDAKTIVDFALDDAGILQVGHAFVDQHYHMLHESPQLMRRFYQEVSQYAWSSLTKWKRKWILLAYKSREKLARRLLFYKSANDDHEKSILTKLKQQYWWSIYLKDGRNGP
ncbi:hypothetical protein P8452_16709 [Trifolium repens]|nr:hypothetical protein P8452_16709 [Trifolium repens]